MTGVALCRQCVSQEGTSEEHVILSSIGGRVVVRGVLCTPCNGHFGETIDAVVAKQFEPIRMMLAIEGDRGQTASIRGRTDDGREVILGPGLQPRSAARAPENVALDENGFSGTFHSLEAARQYNESLQRKNFGRRNVVVTGASDNIEFLPPVNIDMQLGGADFMRSSIKSVLTLLAKRELCVPSEILARAWRYVGGEPEETTGVAMHLATGPGPWAHEALGRVSHRIAVRSCVARGLVEADVRYFGEIGVVARIECAVEEAFAIAYGIDPISGADASADDWSGAIEDPRSPTGDYFAALEVALNIVAVRAHERETELLLKRITEDALLQALEVYPNREPPEFFSALVAGLVANEVRLIRSRRNQTRPAPGNIGRIQPKKRGR